MTTNYITQDYFDELCIENHELFDGDVDDAVKETMEQLKGTTLDHIFCTFPTAANRNQIHQFHMALDECNGFALMEYLAGPEETTFRYLFLALDGFSKLCQRYARGTSMDVWERSNPSSTTSRTTPELLLLACLDRYCPISDVTFRTAFQTAAPILISPWLDSYHQNTYDTKTNHQEQTGSVLLVYWSICYKSIYRCEANKKLWMKQETFPPLLLNVLEKQSSHDVVVVVTGCQILTCLCTFDDCHNSDLVQSGHQTVQILATSRTIEILHGMIRDNTTTTTTTTTISSDWIISALQALRALAVQDQVVVRMMKDGVLATALALFTNESTTNNNNSNNNVVLLTALLGLFRNLSANDAAKHQLCSQDSMKALQFMGSTIQTSREAVEHALAWIAAMALRSPQNASFLLGISMADTIILWMQAYPDSVLVQRQGALALRNLASRCSREEKTLLLAESREVLTLVTARHLACQDQVYAALRDMGASGVVESMVHVETLPDGEVRVRKAEQFGEGHNTNFRPTFD